MLDEIKAIGTLDSSGVVMIDDARLFLSPPPAPIDPDTWPTLQEVLSALSDLSEEHEPIVIDDVIVFLPSSSRELVRDYAREHSTDWLAEIARARETNERLGGVENAIESLSVHSTSRLVDVESRLESVQRGIGDLGEGSRAIQEGIAEFGEGQARQLENARREFERTGEDLRATLDRRIGELQDSVARVERRLQGIEEQGVHIEEVQRLVTGLAEAEERRHRRRQVVTRSRPWSRLKRSVSAFRQHWGVRLSRLRREPKLGRLQHHPPTPLRIPMRYLNSAAPADPPSISIVTPSLDQGEFLERTIRSVVDQGYPRSSTSSRTASRRTPPERSWSATTERSRIGR